MKLLQKRSRPTLINSLLFSLLVLFILAIFQPFGLDTVVPKSSTYPLIFGYSFIGFLAILIPNLVFRNYLNDKPLYIEIAVIFTATLLIGHLLGLFLYQYFMELSFSWGLFGEFFWFSGSTVVIPFLYYTFYIINNRNRESLSPVRKGKIFVLEGNNRKEKISFKEEQLLYLRSSKNYVEVYLLEDQQVQRHLLRNTFGNILEQLDKESVKRVHRSFAVNLNQGFVHKKNELVLEELGLTVPVSDSYSNLLRN